MSNNKSDEESNNVSNEEVEDIDVGDELAHKIIKEKKHDAGAADLEKVTDYAEETEISASDISAMMGLIGEEVADRQAKEKQLLKVKISKDDVDLIMREFEIPCEKAERALREQGGNLLAALSALTN